MESLIEYDAKFQFGNEANKKNWKIVKSFRIQEIENNMEFQFNDQFYDPIQCLWLDPQVHTKFDLLSGYSILDSAK